MAAAINVTGGISEAFNEPVAITGIRHHCPIGRLLYGQRACGKTSNFIQDLGSNV